MQDSLQKVQASKELTERCQVLVVEDRQLLAESLNRALEIAGLQSRLVTESSLQAVTDAVDDDAANPTVAIVAVGFGTENTTELTIGFLASRGIPTIVITGGDDRLRLARCVAEGAIGIIDKHSSFEKVASMIKETAGCETLLSRTEIYRLQDELRRHHASIAERRKPVERLTDRERSVLEALTKGHRAEQIATQGFVTISTVRSQIRAVLTKLGVSSQLAAVAMANQADIFGRITAR